MIIRDADGDTDRDSVGSLDGIELGNRQVQTLGFVVCPDVGGLLELPSNVSCPDGSHNVGETDGMG